VTDPGWWNSAEMDEAATRSLVTRSNPGEPPQVYLADAEGQRVAWIEENRLDASHPYAPHFAAHVQPSFGTLQAADGTQLHYRMLSPPREPGRRYPVFLQVYGGPGAGRQATRAWGNPVQQYLVQHGWIVFSLDNRGSPDRGHAFEAAISHAMGGVEVQDQLAGVHWLQSQAYVDPHAIAVNGWSYGGYMTLRLLEAAPGTFAAGVAGAPVTRWELYDTHYTERYMGIDPRGRDAKAYNASDAIDDAAKIRDPLMLIHGMADDNVVFDNSTALMAALQGRSQPFEMMVYPGATHGVSGEARQLHLWRTITDFLARRVSASH
jgi:dipeptidyl-peptidase-4